MGVLLPTNHVSPDATLGGIAYDSHNNTSASGTAGSGENQSYRAFSFQSEISQVLELRLKFDWTYSNSDTSDFEISYSTNNGGVWNLVVDRGLLLGSGSENILLSPTQNIGDVQIRAFNPNPAASVTTTSSISNIRLEAFTSSKSVVIGM